MTGVARPAASDPARAGVGPRVMYGGRPFWLESDRDGSFGFRWTSRSVNQYNPSCEGIHVPEHMRGPIMDAFTRATGRSARSGV
jgi:hypothetical protein